VLAAGQTGSPDADAALEELCRAYWYPLYAFARRLGHEPADAQDLAQGFFEHFLASKLVQRVAPDRGRFRSFLLVSFRHFIEGERARNRALKRGGGAFALPLEATEAEGRFARERADDYSPATLYDRAWAASQLEQAFALLESEFAGANRAPLFAALHPLLQGDRAASYAELARELGMTEASVKVTVWRMRRRYRELLRAVIAHTVSSPLEVEEELGHLVAILRG
jgi:RNA polymerase sigma-70 factor (ECF subfamily)